MNTVVEGYNTHLENYFLLKMDFIPIKSTS